MKSPHIQTNESLELLYVYCGNYHNIQNVGLVLSPKKSISFENHRLVISDSAYNGNIFPDRIQSVTCLVGKNGSGKSSFLELLGTPLWDLSLFSNEEDYCFKVYLLGKEHYLIEELCSKNNSKCMIVNLKGVPIIEKESRCVLYLCTYRNGIFEQCKNTPNTDLSKLLSSLQFFYKTKENSEHSGIPSNVGFIRNCYLPSQIGFEQQYKFLCSIKNNKVCGGLLYDKNVHLSFQLRNDVNLGIHSLLKSIDNFKLVFKEKLRNVKKTKKDLLKPRCSAKNDCIIKFLENLLDYLVEFANIDSLSSVEETDDYGDYLMNTLSSIGSEVDTRLWSLGHDVWIFTDFFNRLQKLPESCFTYEGQIVIPTINEDPFICAFLTLWDFSFILPQLDWLHKCFDLTWCCISDGEEQFINEVYSLYEVLNQAQCVEHAVVLLDEPDNMMHPETARCFLSYLYNVLEKTKTERTTFQIIIVTHSPLLLSDLPKDCVYLLHKSDNGFCLAERPNSQTFAANIHSLLAQSFFLESTIGAYSERYIKDICQSIKNLSSTESDSEAIKKICTKIDLIGEEFIRMGLLNKLKEHLLPKHRRNVDNNNSLQILLKQLSDEQ